MRTSASIVALAVAAMLVPGLLSLGLDAVTATGDNSITSPDTEGRVGTYTSLALDANGYPVVGYYDETNNDLKILHCNDADCSGDDESITSPDTAGNVGQHTSLAMDASGNPVVSYYDYSNDDLKVLHCNDPNCEGGDESITSPDTEAEGYYSLALDSSGNPVVSYYGFGDLRVMHCNDPNCSGDDESIVHPDTGGVGFYTSLVLDAQGHPVVSYLDSTNSDLKILHCNDANCSGDDESIASPDTPDAVGLYTSLALDSSGNPVVSYIDSTNSDLKVLHCNDANCTGGDESIARVDGAGGFGIETFLVLDASGHPVVSYQGLANQDLRVLHCNDPNCSGDDESITSPDTGFAGYYSSLVLDASGNPVVSYWEGSPNWDLKALHCADPDCSGAKVSRTPLPSPTTEATNTAIPSQTPTATPTATSTQTATITATRTPIRTPTPSGLTGDVGCDGIVNSVDAALVLQYGAGLVQSLACQGNADVSGDSLINAIDAALILQFTAGLINSLTS